MMIDSRTADANESDGSLLYAALRAVGALSPHAPAVVGFDGTVTSYRQLVEATDAVAETLCSVAEFGRVVGVAVDDPVTFIAVYFAAAELGMVAVLLDTRSTPEEKARLVAQFDLKVLVFDGAAGSGSVEYEVVGTADAPHEYLPTDFVLHCTSGSTGVPKGIVMSQAAVMARMRAWSREAGLLASDVVLCALPAWHGHGTDILILPSLLSGATVVFTRGALLTGRGLGRMISNHGVTVISGLPVMYQMLVAADGVDSSMLGTLRLAMTASAPIAADTQARFRERFGLPLRQGYGLGEIGMITYDAEGAGNGTIGLPVRDIDWRLEPVDMSDEEPEVFELLVRGPSLARGYYRDPVAQASMFVDGWLRTHDLVAASAAGWFVRGRKSTFINVTGNKVAPIDVETALRKCGGVVDCAVVGIPDGDGGEQIAALIVAAAGGDPETVRRQIGSRLQPFQLPQQYTFVAAIPRTAVGKTDYRATKAIALGAGAAAI
ncbi:class I adenylate-forming enzyme family protein [Nocardia sp. NPDC051463]|uniref:class I adenylate-forming enzyme family protein n=1 Tax=Nocardia sp. NPDC051463 TaxID=3154845 RepID=UPI003424751F